MLIAGAAECTEHGAPVADIARVLAAILDAPVIEKILTHLGLQARAPPRASERGQLTGSFGAWKRGQRRPPAGRYGELSIEQRVFCLADAALRW